MSQGTLEDPRMDESTHAQRTRTARIVIVIVMLVSLVASALTRDWARAERVIADRGSSPLNTNGQTISSMNSFTLALLLGGLRGPLVMMLWTSSESQKTAKNLEDFDTKVELIRLLQPEFDTVKIFQIWNKAYNISVQMSSLTNKYTTILDAIDYGESDLRINPNNLNVLQAVGDVYFNKLGTAAEKQFYRERVRRETLPHKQHQRLSRDDPGWRRIELDSLVDANGMIDPNLLHPRRPRPAGLAADQPYNDGSQLQYLKPFQPFTYGISPLGIGYNYYMQAQTLQRTTHARHAQLSDQVVDSRPSIALKFWAEEEQELGRRHEQAAFAITLPTSAERPSLEMPTGAVPLTQKPTDQARLLEAIYNYDLSAKLTTAAFAEYQRHLALYGNNLFVYQSHLDGLQATQHLSLGDAAFLRAMTATGDERTKQIALAKAEYMQAMYWHQLIVMKYYTDDTVLAQVLPGIPKETLEKVPPFILQQALQASGNPQLQESHGNDREEYYAYMGRIGMRLDTLNALK